ncbi:ATP-dependent RNA helicase DBP6 [Babesia sp. Xinjiang]|uniref:ATP-dependent RNA helicase DBP6 n=1 Tax=Babesia sp. Xinjiang TaxID=462227 RepID=UPI000A215F91|nr:ATP-dependent RNA helicase DBP6 [Babesia sp. Xinjiang]ORM39730.1 ATP-dependent RNA helicase DBP6 [Babesia sp. Xinjiang]
MTASESQSAVIETAPLWVDRIRTLGSKSSCKSARELLEEWKVHPHLIRILESHNITQLFPVQEKVIPMLITCDALDRYSVTACDIVVTAPTGQGKTLCYLLPIINSIVRYNRIGLFALILAPTRELVKQISDFCSWFVEDDPGTYDLRGGELLRVRSCHGNTSFIDDHTYLIEHRPQVVVFTPGRFVEHFTHREATREKVLDFSTLQWMIIDEVDLLLSQRFYNWTAAVMSICNECQKNDERLYHTFMPSRPRKILVSATIPTKSSEIDLLQLYRPLLVKSSSSLYSLPDNLSQLYITTTRNNKAFALIMLLCHIMATASPGDKSIVFCSFKDTAHATARMLEMFFSHMQSHLRILELSARISQKQRNEVLERFGNEDTMCLVCSDVASRGMNFANTRTIINYDFPKNVTKYIHRIGRTARANESGTSYIILSGKDESEFSNFTAELHLGTDEVRKLSMSDLLSVKREPEIKAAYGVVKDMVDRCLELEKVGSIAHDSPLPSNWMALLQEPEKGAD